MRATTLLQTGWLAASTLFRYSGGTRTVSSSSSGTAISAEPSRPPVSNINNNQSEECGVHSGMRLGIDYPELVVFDLDACLWDQETFELNALPNRTELGDLNGLGQGVIGAYSGYDKIALHEGALVALQEHAQRQYPGMKVCFASSATTPFAEQIGRTTLKLLEVLPGMSVWDVVMRDWDGQDVNQIGRQPPLSSDKAKTHFPRIRQLTGIPYNKMLFFDDCIWGDNCGMVAARCKENGQSVITHRTPSGLREVDWRRGLDLYRQAHNR